MRNKIKYRSHPDVLCFRLILAGYFFRRTIPPLIRTSSQNPYSAKPDSLFRKSQQTSARSVRKGYPPRICAMSVLLRTDIINIHLFDTRLIPSHHRAGIAIDIIFYRTAFTIGLRGTSRTSFFQTPDYLPHLH